MKFYLYEPVNSRFLDVRQVIDPASFSQIPHIVWSTNSRTHLTGEQVDCVQELMLMGIEEEKTLRGVRAIITVEEWGVAKKIYEKLVAEPVECWYIEARGEPIFTSMENGIL